MVRLAPEIRDAAEKYVRLRLSNMRGLDLNVFDFDYDLTWAALFITSEGKVLGRFGGRDGESANKYRTLLGLRHALEQGLQTYHEQRKEKQTKPLPPRRAENYEVGQKLSPRSCIHCHHVHEFQRAEAMEKGTWHPRQEYRYPDPRSLGLEMDAEQGNRLIAVKDGMALLKGDVLLSIDDKRVHSYADIVTALDRAPESGSLSLRIARGAKQSKAELSLEPGWKTKTDISWRWSLKTLEPEPPVSGEDLSLPERRLLGIASEKLAMRQGPFLSQRARQAGVQIGDVIVGVDGSMPLMTARQFDVHFRLFLRDRKEVELNLLRGKEKVRVLVKVR